MKAAIIFAILLFSTSSFAQCVRDVCIGKKAIDNFDRIGEVTRIEGDRIFYRTSNGFEHDTSSSSLSGEVSTGRFALNSRVLDNFDRQGRVQTAFSDGRVSYQTSNGFSHVSRSVSPEVPSLGNVRPSISVLDNFDRVGTADAIYENGKVSYSTPTGFNHISTNVSPAVSEHDGIRTRSIVADNFDRIGIVANVFENGKIQYQTDKGSSHISSTVVPSVVQLPSGTRSGIIVVDNFNRVGTANHVFRDGRVQYTTGNGFQHMSRDVSPEVEAHPRYQKNIEYASNSEIGEAIRFFANEKIQLEGDSICDELFEEVESVEGISKDTEVVLPGNEGKVENIFANRMARIKTQDTVVNARILNEKEFEERFVRQNWLRAINYRLNEPDVIFRINVAVEKKNYGKLLQLLKTDLNDRNSPYRGEQKRKLSNYLETELRRIQP